MWLWDCLGEDEGSGRSGEALECSREFGTLRRDSGMFRNLNVPVGLGNV